MVTVTLTPDLEEVIVHCAQKKGTTPELYVLEELRMNHLPPRGTLGTAEPQGETMADFFKGYAGSVNSCEFRPDGARLSEDTGRKFKELMARKHRAAKL